MEITKAANHFGTGLRTHTSPSQAAASSLALFCVHISLDRKVINPQPIANTLFQDTEAPQQHLTYASFCRSSAAAASDSIDKTAHRHNTEAFILHRPS